MSCAKLFTRPAFDRALRPLYPALRHYAALRCGWNEADDIVQQALLPAWAVIERFDASRPPNELFAWLRRFIDNVSEEHIRQSVVKNLNGSVAFSEQILDRLCADPARAEMPVLRQEELYRLMAKAEFTDRQRACLEAWLEGKSRREIAAHTGLAPSTVWEHIAAAARRLRRMRVSETYMAREAFYEETQRTVYRAPEAIGTALGREKMRALALEDARNGALCRRRQHQGRVSVTASPEAAER